MAKPQLTERQRAMLRNARIAAGLTQATLGGRVGITSQAVTMIESGRLTPSLEVLSGICGILGFEVEVVSLVKIKKKRK